jgi:hypothetical protein
VREPVTLLEGCLAPAIERTRASGSGNVECDLRQVTILVGVPDEDVDSEEFIKLGISRDAADMVRNREIARPRWCAVADVTPRAATPAAGGDRRLIAHVECVQSSVSIPKAIIVRAQNVSVSLDASGQRVVLSRLEGLGSRK